LLRHVPLWLLYVRSVVHIARASTGANQGETAGGTCARGSHGYSARRLSATNLHEVFPRMSMRAVVASASHSTWHISISKCYSRFDRRRESNSARENLEPQVRVIGKTTGMTNINYLSLDIFQRLHRWRTSEDVNNSSISGSRPWRKAAAKVSRNTGPDISAWHTKMVAQAPHDTPTATRQPRALSPDYQRRGLRRVDLPSRKPKTARLLLVRHSGFRMACDRCADRARVRAAISEPPATTITSMSIATR
jgi:hypothetical protein